MSRPRLLAIALVLVSGMATIGMAADPPAKPVSVRKLVSDGKHNAFTAMVRWKGSYWLAFRKAESHGYHECDIVLMKSLDGEEWTEAKRFNFLVDDRDPQFLATENRLFLYAPCLTGSKCTSFVTYTDDGASWSEPKPVYEPRYIVWKPTTFDGKFYATAHVKAEGQDGGNKRAVDLITSDDGIAWKKISTIRSGNWESETTIHFSPDKKLTAFLRQKYSVPGFIMESEPPYEKWSQRPADTHLSGHFACTFNGVTYLLSRTMDGAKQGTMIYTYENGKLVPWCELPSGGDSSYPAAVQVGDQMLVSYYASHEGNASIYLAKVPLKTK